MSYMTVYRVYHDLCRKFDTPRSLAASLLLENGEFEQFLSLDVKPLDYEQFDVLQFRNDYFVSEYLSKYEAHDTKIDTEAVALSGFTAAEEQCAEANVRINHFLRGDETLVRWWPVIRRAQQYIRKTIGESPDLRLFAHYCKWGSGSTYSVRGYEVRVDNKVRENQISITRRAVRYFRYALGEDLPFMQARRIPAEGPCSLLAREFSIVHGGKGMTVPKNAKTDRFICNEPSGNIFLQLGAGKLIRLALKRVGIDLDDQTINQGLAQSALELGLATVDLKAASDTICAALVWLLLPEKWVRLLDDLRSPFIEVSGRWYEAEKFSAMGNGFTFELESLIFWALTTALRDERRSVGRVSVYGDDIICPSHIVPELQELFNFVGFRFNEKKTHSTGGFRESCGKHYFWGQDVTPIYQKEALLQDTDEESTQARRRFRNRLLYHAVDRVGVIVNETAYADKAFRDVLKQFGPQPGPLTPLVSEGHRSLDVGDVVCRRQVKLKWHGWTYSCRALKFKATTEKGHIGALYSVHMRARARNLVDVSKYLTPQVQRRLPFKYMARAYALRPSDNLPLEFDGTVTLRDEGYWEDGRAYYEEPLMLAWT